MMQIDTSSCLYHSIWWGYWIIVFAWFYYLVHIVLFISRCHFNLINFMWLLYLLWLPFITKLIPTRASYLPKLSSKIRTIFHLSFWVSNFLWAISALVLPLWLHCHPDLSLYFLITHLVTLVNYWAALRCFILTQTRWKLKRWSCLLKGEGMRPWVYCRTFIAAQFFL